MRRPLSEDLFGILALRRSIRRSLANVLEFWQREVANKRVMCKNLENPVTRIGMYLYYIQFSVFSFKLLLTEQLKTEN
jgi:hypothetical protein